MSWESPQTSPPTLRPLSVGDILDVTFRLYRANFAAFVKIAAVGVIPTQLLILLLLWSLPIDEVNGRSNTFGNTSNVEINADDLWKTLATGLGVVMLGMVASLIVTAAITKAVAHYYVDGEKPAVGESLRSAISVLAPMIGMTILFVFGVGFGLIACVVPGVFLYIAWSVASPALIMEHAGPVTALGRSMRLVRPRWWPTFGLLLLVLLMTSIAAQVIAIPFGLAADNGGFFRTAASTNFGELFVGTTVPGILSGLLTTPFTAIVVVVLYVDLRVRHEGFNAQVLASSVGATPPPVSSAIPPRPAPPTTPPPPPPPEQQWGMPPNDPSPQ
jgi:hypothetical protein